MPHQEPQHSSDPVPTTPDEVRRRMQDFVANLSPDDLKSFGMSLMAGALSQGGQGFEFPAQEPRPELRRPRRSQALTYRVRVDLKDTKPPVWRRLDLDSTLTLDQLHDILQVAFGWTDSHLHRFASGSPWDMSSQLYLCPFDVEEGEDGIPEHEVRLDEVLAEPGDRLLYVYDFGDDWEHELRLEELLARSEPAERAVCVGGRRWGPPEDCGGPPGFAELQNAEPDPGPFDPASVNAELAQHQRTAGVLSDETSLPAPVLGLLRRLHDPALVRKLLALAEAGRLDGGATPEGRAAGEPDAEPDEAASMMRPYLWMLDRVGDQGIALTSAGYLPPVHVEAASTELGLGQEWMGKNNREIHTLPVLILRETVQALGLLRKNRGRLVLTKRGRELRGDPPGLTRHLAAKLPLGKPESIEFTAGLVVLLGVAAGQDVAPTAFRRLVAEVLSDLGWRRAGWEPLTDADAAGATRDLRHILTQVHAIEDDNFGMRSATPTSGGISLARTALREVN